MPPRPATVKNVAMAPLKRQEISFQWPAWKNLYEFVVGNVLWAKPNILKLKIHGNVSELQAAKSCPALGKHNDDDHRLVVPTTTWWGGGLQRWNTHPADWKHMIHIDVEVKSLWPVTPPWRWLRYRLLPPITPTGWQPPISAVTILISRPQAIKMCKDYISHCMQVRWMRQKFHCNKKKTFPTQHCCRGSTGKSSSLYRSRKGFVAFCAAFKRRVWSATDTWSGTSNKKRLVVVLFFSSCASRVLFRTSWDSRTGSFSDLVWKSNPKGIAVIFFKPSPAHTPWLMCQNKLIGKINENFRQQR